MMRLTLAGAELAGFEIEQPGASVRLLVPSPESSKLVMPEWNGNEFLLPDGSRPVIRTFTPRAMSAEGLILDMVIHEEGTASQWATNAGPAAPAAISGPGRGYQIDRSATRLILLGDETAIPAISQLLESIPESVSVHVTIEVRDDFGRVDVPDHAGATVAWHDVRSPGDMGEAMLASLRDGPIDETTRVWCAGEAAVMHRVRSYLFKEMGIPRSRAAVRGYWKARG